MKNTVGNFKFKDIENSQVYDIINSELPIGLKNENDLIQRIHEKYPYIKKYEVAIIVKYVFEVIRENLILGKAITFYNLFCDMHLSFIFYKSVYSQNSCRLSVKNKTSRKFTK